MNFFHSSLSTCAMKISKRVFEFGANTISKIPYCFSSHVSQGEVLEKKSFEYLLKFFGFFLELSMTNCLISILVCSFDLIAFFHDCEEFDVQFPVKTEIPSRYRSQYSFVPIRKRKLW